MTVGILAGKQQISYVTEVDICDSILGRSYLNDVNTMQGTQNLEESK